MHHEGHTSAGKGERLAAVDRYTPIASFGLLQAGSEFL